jgi:hypothetical protein
LTQPYPKPGSVARLLKKHYTHTGQKTTCHCLRRGVVAAGAIATSVPLSSAPGGISSYLCNHPIANEGESLHSLSTGSIDGASWHLM